MKRFIRFAAWAALATTLWAGLSGSTFGQTPEGTLQPRGEVPQLPAPDRGTHPPIPDRVAPLEEVSRAPETTPGSAPVSGQPAACTACPEPTGSTTAGKKSLHDSMHETPFKGLFDSLHPQEKSGHWYDKFSIRGYTQVRWGRTLERNEVDPQLLGDRGIDGNTEDFGIRRMRMIFFGDVGEHLSFYIQPDFASGVSGQATNQFYAQLRDAYADIYTPHG